MNLILTSSNSLFHMEEKIMFKIAKKSLIMMMMAAMILMPLAANAAEYFEVEERDLFMEDLKTAREAFITGTTKKVMPVVQVDDQLIGSGNPGEITLKLQHLYNNYIEEYLNNN